MTDLDKGIASQLPNIEKRTGKSLAELTTIVKASGLSKHDELVAMLKVTLGMGHGDASLLVHTVRKSDESTPTNSQPGSAVQMLEELYVGPKAALRPIHERLLAEMEKFGAFDQAPTEIGFATHSSDRPYRREGDA